MAKIVSVPEAELQAVIHRREALEQELSREMAIETEKSKVADLEKKILLEQAKIHPSKLQKLRESVQDIGKTLKELETKKKQLLTQHVI